MVYNRKGRQTCLHNSRHLFTIYSECIMRESLEGFEGGVKVGRRTLTNLRCADDVVLMAHTLEELQELVDSVNRSLKNARLSLNAKKMKVLKVKSIEAINEGNILVDDEPIANVE